MGQPRTRIINTPKGRTIIQLHSVEDLSNAVSPQRQNGQNNQGSNQNEMDTSLLQSRKRFYSMDGLTTRNRSKLSVVKEAELSSVNENHPPNFYTDLYPNNEPRRRSTSVSVQLGAKGLSGFISPTKLDKTPRNINGWKLNHTKSTPSLQELQSNNLKAVPIGDNNGTTEEAIKIIKKIPPKKPPRSRARAMSVDNLMTMEMKNHRRQSISGTPQRHSNDLGTGSFNSRSKPLPLSLANGDPLDHKPPPKRRPVMRAPSRLYKVLDAAEASKRKDSNLPAILGPEFVVRSKEPPKVISLISKHGNQKNFIKKVTVVIITGRRIEVKCEPSSSKIKHVLEAIMDEEQLPLPHLFGLSILIGGEFHFLSPNTKLHKIAPVGWKDPHPTKHGLVQDNFTLHLRLVYYLRFGDLVRLEAKMRRLIYLQLRHDLLEGRLPLPSSSIIQLTALTLQAEFGDHVEQEPGYFMLEHYVPETLLGNSRSNQLTEELCRRHSTLGGLLPYQAQARFITMIQDMLYYGTHFFKGTQEKTGCNHWIGIWPGGLLVLTGPPGPDTLCRASLHPWPVVKRVSYTSSRLAFTVKSPGGILKLKFLMASNKSSYVCYLCKVHQNFYQDQSAIVPQGVSQISDSKEIASFDLHLHENANSKELYKKDEEKQMQSNKDENNSTEEDKYRSLSPTSDMSLSCSNTTVTTHDTSLMSNKEDYYMMKAREQVRLRKNLKARETTLSSQSPVSDKNPTLSPASSKGDFSRVKRDMGTLSSVSTLSDKDQDLNDSVSDITEARTYQCRKYDIDYSSDDPQSTSLDHSLDSSVNLDVAKSKPESSARKTTNDTPTTPNQDINKIRLNQKILRNVFWNQSDDMSDNSNSGKEDIKPKMVLASTNIDQVDNGLEKMSISANNSAKGHQRSYSNIEDGSTQLDSINSDCSRGYDSDETLLRSPKKGWFNVKMGTRVSAAALHKQRLRSLETVQPLPSLEELTTSPSAIVVEPTVQAVNLEESVSDSLVERFLKSGSSTSSFGCCERRLSSVTIAKDISGSLGVMIAEGVDHGLYIQAVTPGGPAHKGGQLRAGDRIVGINGLSVESFSYNRAVDMLRNAPPVINLLVSQPIFVLQSPTQSAQNTYPNDSNTPTSLENNPLNISSTYANTFPSRQNTSPNISSTSPRPNSYGPSSTPKSTTEPRQRPRSSVGVNYASDSPVEIGLSLGYLPRQNSLEPMTDAESLSSRSNSCKDSKQEGKDVRSGHVTLVTLNTTQKDNT